MLYLKTEDGLRLIILETANLESLKQGFPLWTVDKQVIIGWTPDPEWLSARIRETDGDLTKVAELIQESQKRPDACPRETHEVREYHFGDEDTPEVEP